MLSNRKGLSTSGADVGASREPYRGLVKRASFTYREHRRTCNGFIAACFVLGIVLVVSGLTVDTRAPAGQVTVGGVRMRAARRNPRAPPPKKHRDLSHTSEDSGEGKGMLGGLFSPFARAGSKRGVGEHGDVEGNRGLRQALRRGDPEVAGDATSWVSTADGGDSSAAHASGTAVADVIGRPPTKMTAPNLNPTRSEYALTGCSLMSPAWQSAAAAPAVAAAARAEATAREAPTLDEARAAAVAGVGDLKVYVYDLPPRFNRDMIDRIGGDGNTAFWYRFTRSEEYLHILMANSTVRTMDPEEADLFWMPVYGASFISMGPESSLRDRSRMLVLDAVAYVRLHYPFWDRYEGRDHLFVFPHDQGACYAIRRNRCLTESPLTPQMLDLTRNSIYIGANGDLHNPAFRRGHDIVIPPVVSNQQITDWAMGGQPPVGPRQTLAGFRGQVSLEQQNNAWFAVNMLYGTADEQRAAGVSDIVTPPVCGGTPRRPKYCAASLKEEMARSEVYSNGVRQQMFFKYEHHPTITFTRYPAESYVDDMLATTVCISPLGHATWTVRTFEAIMLGCIPLIIADDTVYPFQDWLDWSKFSIIIPTTRALDLDAVLETLTADKILAMQQELKRVTRAFVFNLPENQPGDVFSWLLLELGTRAKEVRALKSGA